MKNNKIDTRKKILEMTWKMMEQGHGHSIRMSDIAKNVGISRQAVYLHFGSRTELMVSTVQYVDEMQGINEQFSQFLALSTGVEQLEAYVEIWASHVSKIYGLGKALLSARETDKAAAAAWDDRMSLMRDGCREVVEALYREGNLTSEWAKDSSSRHEAVDMFWTILSIYNWEQLVIECNWPLSKYVEWVKVLLKTTFVVQAK